MHLPKSQFGLTFSLLYIFGSIYLIATQGLFGENFIVATLGLPWSFFMVFSAASLAEIAPCSISLYISSF